MSRHLDFARCDIKGIPRLAVPVLGEVFRYAREVANHVERKALSCQAQALSCRAQSSVMSSASFVMLSASFVMLSVMLCHVEHSRDICFYRCKRAGEIYHIVDISTSLEVTKKGFRGSPVPVLGQVFRYAREVANRVKRKALSCQAQSSFEN